MSFCLLAASAIAIAQPPAAVQPASAPRVTKSATARVVVITLEKLQPMDRNAKHKGYDRNVKRRGDILLIEFY
jgi:hypothetical protein